MTKVQRAVSIARIKQRHNVRMTKPRRDLDLVEEASSSQCRRELGANDLHRYRPPVFDVLGEVDACHPAASELSDNLVSVAEHLRKRRRDLVAEELWEQVDGCLVQQQRLALALGHESFQLRSAHWIVAKRSVYDETLIRWRVE
jgi:hypothetical protein